MVVKPISITWHDTKSTGYGSGSLSNSCLLRLSTQLNLGMSDLKTRQTYINLSSMHNWSQECWVWKLTIFIFTWAQRVVEPKNIESDNLSDPCLFRFSAQLNPRTLGLEARQSYMYLGSAHCEPKDVEFRNSPDPMSTWAQCVVKPKVVEFRNLLDPYILGLSVYLNPRMLGLTSRHTYISLGLAYS